MATGNWDDKNERGKRDRIWLSRTEYWEMNYFIDNYIQTRGWSNAEKTRAVIKNAINAYSGEAPIKRQDMNMYLDALYPPRIKQ